MKNFSRPFALLSVLPLLIALTQYNLFSATQYSTLVKEDQPFLYWNFDEDSNQALQQIKAAAPSRSTANDLIPTGAARVGHSTIGSSLNLGNAAEFSGSTYFSAEDMSTGSNVLSGPWIIEFWVQVQGVNEGRRNDYLVNFGPGGGNRPAVLYDYVGGAAADNGLEMFAGPRTGAGPELNDESWHHVLVVYYGDGTTGVADRLDIYLDGALAAERIRGGFASGLTVDSRIVVGTSAPQFAAGDGFEGRLDELAIYELSAEKTEAAVTAKAGRIAAHYQAASSPGSYSAVVKAESPFLYWNFDEASGPALEQTGRGSTVVTPALKDNDLVPSGAVLRVGHDAIGSGLRLGNALELDGASFMAAADLNIASNTLAPPYAIEFWMQVLGENEGILRNEYLIGMGIGGNEPAVIYDYVGGGGTDQLELFHGLRTTPGPAISDEGWHHVLIVFYGTDITGVSDRLEIYLDGVSDHESIRNTFRRDLNLSGQFIVGSSPVVADAFTGRMDEVAVYSLAAYTTESELEGKATAMAGSHFTAAAALDGNYSATILADQPVLYWDFNEASGNAVQKVKYEEVPDDVDPEPIVDNDLVPTGAVQRVGHEVISSGLRLGNAIELDGASFMRAADLKVTPGSLPPPYAIEFWMQVLGDNEGFLRNEYLIGMGNGGNEPAVIYDYVGGGGEDQLELFHGLRTAPGPAISDDGWHHLLIVFYGTDTTGVSDRLEVYLDGVSDHQSIRNTFRRDLNLAGQFIVGSSPVLADAFAGRMDGVAIYDLAAFPTEAALEAKVTAMASSHFAAASAPDGNYDATVLADDPLLYWNFDEDEGNALQQVKPKEERIVDNDLTPVGATRVSHAGISSGLDLGNAADLSGSNYFVAEDMKTSQDLLGPPWAIEFWLQPQGANTALRNDYLINFGTGGGNRPAVLYDYVGGARPQNGLELFAGPRSDAGPTVDDSEWHHVVFAYYGDGASGVADRLDIYLDGVSTAGNVRGSFASGLALDTRLVVGNSAPQFAAGDGFQGRIDELAIYDLRSLGSETAVTSKVAGLASRHFAAALAPIDDPSLTIVKTVDRVVVSWPVAAAGFALESTESLVIPNWLPSTETVVTSGRTHSVTLAPAKSAQFFRLRK